MDLHELQLASMEERSNLLRKRKSLEPGEADAILKRRKSITSINEIERLPYQTSSNASNILTTLPSFTDAFPEKPQPSSNNVQTTHPTNQIGSSSTELQSTENASTLAQKPNQFQRQAEVSSSLTVVELNNKSNKLELPGLKKKYYNPSYSADLYPFKVKKIFLILNLTEAFIRKSGSS